MRTSATCGPACSVSAAANLISSLPSLPPPLRSSDVTTPARCNSNASLGYVQSHYGRFAGTKKIRILLLQSIDIVSAEVKILMSGVNGTPDKQKGPRVLVTPRPDGKSF